MSAFIRKQYAGAASPTTTTTSLTDVGTSVNILSTNGWPSLADIPFYVVIEPGTANEEKCLATISGNTLTIARGQDDTTAVAHNSGSSIYPVFTANDADEANEIASKLTTKGDLLTTDGDSLLRLAVGTDGYFLKVNSSASSGIEWSSIPTINNLDDIGDVNVASASVGEYLKYDGMEWISASISAGGITVSDTAPASPGEGDLWYDSTSLDTFVYYDGVWVQQNTPPSEIYELGDLVDVNVLNAVENNILQFDGAGWIAANPTINHLDDVVDVSASAPSSGDFLKWDGSAWVNDVINLGTDTTGNYVTDLVAGTGVAISHTPGEGSTASIAIGQDVSTSAAVVFAGATSSSVQIGISTANEIDTTAGNLVLDSTDGNVIVDDNLTVNGYLLPSTGSGWYGMVWAPNPGGGLGDVAFINYYAESGENTRLHIHNGDNEDDDIFLDSYTTNVSGSLVVQGPVVGNLVGNVTGNASTASALQTARTISLTGDVTGSASFDGTGNIALSTTVNTGSVAIGELSGVVITSPEEYQTLEYDGTNWVNGYPRTVSYVRNVEATTLTTGTAVYLFGGTGDHASVKRASNTAESTSSKTVGLVANSIASNNNGPVVTRGYVDGVDLSAYQNGDALWLGENGQITTTKPSAPNHLVYIGVVVRNNVNGIVYVAAQNGYELDELHNVKLNGTTDGQFLKYNSSSAAWIADTIDLGTDTAGDYVQSLVAGTGVTLSNNSGEGSTPTIAIGQAVGTNASVTFGRVETTGNLIVGQNLYVSGSVVTENQVSLQIDDPFIYLNGSASASGIDIGIAGNYNDGSYAHSGLFRDATDGKWKFFDSYTPEPESPINVAHASYSAAPVVAETFESTVATGTAPFTVSSTTEVANLRANKASQLATARTISLGGDISGSVSFDGSTNVTLTATVQPNSVALGTDTTGNYMADLAEGTGITIVHTPGEGSTATITNAGVTSINGSTGEITGVVKTSDTGTVTSTMIADGTIVNADINSSAAIAHTKLANITAGSVLMGNASAAPTATAISGDITLSSSGVVGISSGVIINSDINANAGISISKLATASAPGRVIVSNASGVATYTEITGEVTIDGTGVATVGNATTATSLETARTISLSGDVSGSVSFDGSADATITATIQPNSVALGTDTTGNYMTDVTAGTGISISHTAGEGSTATITNAGVTSLNGSTGAITGVVKTSDTGTVTSTMIADGTIVNGDINASAAIALSKLASGTAGQIIVANASGVPTYVSESGDITIDQDGVTAISSGVIVNADINASAAIDSTKVTNWENDQVILSGQIFG